MSLYSSQFTVVNNSGYTLTLNEDASSGLSNGNWPTSIETGTAPKTGIQTGNVNINLTAIYDVKGDGIPEGAYIKLDYYIAVFIFGHVSMSLTPVGVFLESGSIWVDNPISKTISVPPLEYSDTSTSVSSGMQTGTYTIGPITES
ncbi:MAG: hypothetical protein GQ574_08920 [Crocinitomix sp.]|nr:hypothetical protein [Crocinitomix sp.]